MLVLLAYCLNNIVRFWREIGGKLQIKFKQSFHHSKVSIPRPRWYTTTVENSTEGPPDFPSSTDKWIRFAGAEIDKSSF